MKLLRKPATVKTAVATPAAKKFAAKKIEKKTTVAKKVEAPARGRKAGVTYSMPDENQETLNEMLKVFVANMDELKVHIGKLNSGTKSAAKKARENIQNMIKTGKEFRKEIQIAKESVQED